MPARIPSGGATVEADPLYTASGATDDELAAAIAAHAAGDATDAELAAALVAVTAEIDSDVATAVGALTASIALKQDAAGAATDAEIGAAGKGFKFHDDDPDAIRPTGFASIEWVGTVEPENVIDGDTWVNPS